MMIVEISGWITAAILLTAGFIQLSKILKTGKATGISPLAWLLYGAASITAYVFAEKYLIPQAILSFLVPGIISLAISAIAYKYNKKRKNDN